MKFSLPELRSSTTTLMREVLTRHWPLWAGLGALWLTTAILQFLAAARTGGHLIYSLDDGYIHMAMAKNLALHGVYGVTRYEFSSSSSSPLWTLLVAFFFVVFGVRDSVPIILEIAVSSFILIIAYVLLKDVIKKTIPMVLMLLGIVFFTPLPLLISTGMEHPLHILLSIVFLWYAARAVVDAAAAHRVSMLAILSVLSVILVLTRLESYALILSMVLLLALRRRWTIVLSVLVASILPLLVYQAISVAHGWRWLPNSVLVRGGIEGGGMFNSIESIIVVPLESVEFWKFFRVAWTNLLSTPYFAVLMGVAIVLLVNSYIRTKQLWKLEHVLLVAYIASVLAHLQFGKIGFFYRYDAYLVSLGVFVLGVATVGLFGALKRWMLINRSRAVVGSLSLLLAIQLPVPLVARCLVSLPQMPRASQNIYEQQYQMGLFLKQYYSGKTVAANDIGAICYLADIHLVDLVGLASADVYQLTEAHEFTTDRVLQLCNDRNVSIAIAYELWLDMSGIREVQRQWQKVGMWKISDNIVCGSNIVTFFAVQPSQEVPLMDNLRTFSKTLPHDVGYWVRAHIP